MWTINDGYKKRVKRKMTMRKETEYKKKVLSFFLFKLPKVLI